MPNGRTNSGTTGPGGTICSSAHACLGRLWSAMPGLRSGGRGRQHRRHVPADDLGLRLTRHGQHTAGALPQQHPRDATGRDPRPRTRRSCPPSSSARRSARRTRWARYAPHAAFVPVTRCQRTATPGGTPSTARRTSVVPTFTTSSIGGSKSVPRPTHICGATATCTIVSCARSATASAVARRSPASAFAEPSTPTRIRCGIPRRACPGRSLTRRRSSRR